MNSQDEKPPVVHAYGVQMRLVSALLRLGIARRVFRMTLGPDGEPYFKVGVAEGEQLAVDLDQLTPADHASGGSPEGGTR